MSKRKDNPNSIKAILLLLMVAVTIGLIFYVKYGTPPQPSQEVTPVPANTTETKQEPRPRTIHIPQAKAQNGSIRWDVDQATLEEGNDPVQSAVNRFLEATQIAPPGAKVRSVRYEHDVAVLDFSPEFVRTYGTDDEHTLLKGIFESVRLNSNAKFVRLTAGGKPIESLGGYDLTTEQPVGLFAKE